MYNTDHNIRPLLSEAAAKRYGHMIAQNRLGQSLRMENISNGLYFSSALATLGLTQILPSLEQLAISTSDLKMAFAGAVGVTAAIIYKKAKQAYRIQEIEGAKDTYNETGLSEEFDHVGITFRGDRPLNTDYKPAKFNFWHNPFHLPSSVGLALHATWHDVVMRPSSHAHRLLKNVFRRADDNLTPHFDYGTDDCCADKGVVMFTKLPEINNEATVQLPASERRITTSLEYTKSSISPRFKSLFSRRSFYSDYTELAVNFAGGLGAAEFCLSVGKQSVISGMQSYQSGDTTIMVASGLYAAFSAFTVYVGTDPLQNFLDDAHDIHKRLNAKYAILDAKKSALKKVCNTVQDIQNKLREACYIEAGKNEGNLDDVIHDITEASSHLDSKDLPAHICEHLRHRGISHFAPEPH